LGNFFWHFLWFDQAPNGLPAEFGYSPCSCSFLADMTGIDFALMSGTAGAL
jgi:hypothetical protein